MSLLLAKLGSAAARDRIVNKLRRLELDRRYRSSSRNLEPLRRALAVFDEHTADKDETANEFRVFGFRLAGPLAR